MQQKSRGAQHHDIGAHMQVDLRSMRVHKTFCDKILVHQEASLLLVCWTSVLEVLTSRQMHMCKGAGGSRCVQGTFAAEDYRHLLGLLFQFSPKFICSFQQRHIRRVFMISQPDDA